MVRCETMKDFAENHTADEMVKMHFFLLDLTENDVIKHSDDLEAYMFFEMMQDPNCVVVYRTEE